MVFINHEDAKIIRPAVTCIVIRDPGSKWPGSGLGHHKLVEHKISKHYSNNMS